MTTDERDIGMEGDSWQQRLADEGEIVGDDVQCPYCGYVEELQDCYDLIKDGGGTHTCSSCDKDFEVEIRSIHPTPLPAHPYRLGAAKDDD